MFHHNPYAGGWSAERQPPLAEDEYLPPEPPRDRANGAAKGAGAVLVAVGVLLAKFKGLLFFLLSFKYVALAVKLFWFIGSFFASVWFYALFWGWRFALIFVGLILVHEFGHYVTMRAYGVPGTLPFFIPGFGALVNMRGRPPSALHEAYIAFAGPLVGTVASAAAYLYGVSSDSALWVAAAYTGFFLNLFNLAPVLPLDGGRVVGAISPRIWLFGLIVFVVAMVALHRFNPLIWLLIFLSIPQAIAAWRGQLDPQYHRLSSAQRAGIAVAYFALAGFLFAAMSASHVGVPGHHPGTLTTLR